MLSFEKVPKSVFIFVFYLLIPKYLSLEDSSILLIPFKGKSLQKEEDPDDYTEPHWMEDDEYPYAPQRNVYNSSTFITQWFYNGMYTLSTIGSKQIESYINIENTKLSIEKCNINRAYSKSTFSQTSYYKPLSSETFSKTEKKIGNDIFTFIGDFSYKTVIKIGETKGNGLDFHFKDNDNDFAICGNIGLNFINLDKTNLIFQLKKKGHINKYMWTLKYQTEEDGIIILGTEPHFYQSDSFFMSQYCKIKAIQNQSPETAWSFKMDEVRTYDKNNNKIHLSQNKVDFLIDRGLIIGTDEYKKVIDELIFNDLINLKICFCETNKFHDEEKGTNNEYYIYYCNKDSFMGNKYTVDKTYYNTFPSLEFYSKETQMTFTLNKDYLFHEIYDRSYFLVVFKKSKTENNIWKLGEPFFSHYQFTFDQEQKTVGFYNLNLERISNSDYLDKIKKQNKQNFEKNSSGNMSIFVIIIVIVILLIILSIGIAFILGKKCNGNRKKRANELNDDDFDYSSQNKLNSNNSTTEDNLVIN